MLTKHCEKRIICIMHIKDRWWVLTEDGLQKGSQDDWGNDGSCIVPKGTVKAWFVQLKKWGLRCCCLQETQSIAVQQTPGKELFRLNYIDNIWGSKWTRSEVGPWNRRQSLAIPKVCDQRFPGAVEMKIKIISMMVFLQFIEGIWEFSVLLYLVTLLLLRNGMSMCTECMCECFN